VKIKKDNLKGGEVIALLEEHLADMYATSPAESVHALDLNALKSSNITFFSAWIDNSLAGCVAVKHLNAYKAELKSMRTVRCFRGSGVASKLLHFVLQFATEQGYKSISLETGTQDYFLPARNLYKKFGFADCGPFSDYKLNPNSHFMTRNV
jgi:putative acetyltransferase